MVLTEEAYKTVGIVSPTYAWGLPVIVREFLQKLTLHTTPDYLWFAATYGTTPGQTGRFAENILCTNGLSVSAKFSVKMPDTWTPLYDLSDKSKVQRINEAAEPQIDRIIDAIQNRACGDFMENKMPLFLAKAFYGLEYDSMRRTSHFTVEDTCIGCGLCARNCPVSAIEIREKRPVSVKDACVMCILSAPLPQICDSVWETHEAARAIYAFGKRKMNPWLFKTAKNRVSIYSDTRFFIANRARQMLVLEYICFTGTGTGISRVIHGPSLRNALSQRNSSSAHTAASTPPTTLMIV